MRAPDNIPWTRCARCGATEVEGRWTFIEDEALMDDLVQRHVTFHEDAEDIAIGMMAQPITDRHTLLHVQAEGVIDDLLYTEERTVRARMSNGVCLDVHTPRRELLRGDRPTAFKRPSPR